MSTKRRAIALLRVSSAAQAGPDRQGLPAQRTTCERIAAANDLTIVEWIEIAGVSGAVVVDDPRFKTMLERIRDPRIHGVIVADMDRLMRPDDPSNYAVFAVFRSTETVLYTSSGPRDFRHDRLLMFMETELAAMERLRIAERTRRGRDEKRRKGVRAEGLVGMPRGVCFDHATGQWAYLYPEVERVRKAFDLLLGGETNLREIWRQTHLGNECDASASIRRVLTQTLYKGVYRKDRNWVKGKAISLPADQIQEWPAPGLNPPLMSPEAWQRAQHILARLAGGRPQRSSPDDRPGTYGGFLQCRLCGSPMIIRRNGRDSSSYVCSQSPARRERRKGRAAKQCPTGSVSVRLADPQIDADLEWILGDEENLRLVIERSLEDAAGHAASPPGELQRRITVLENKKTKVKDAYVDGDFDLVEMRKRLSPIDGELAVLRGMMEAPSEAPVVDDEMIRSLVDVFSCWASLLKLEKRRLLKDFGMRAQIEKPKRGRLRVLRLDIAACNLQGLYKKMKRFDVR